MKTSTPFTVKVFLELSRSLVIWSISFPFSALLLIFFLIVIVPFYLYRKCVTFLAQLDPNVTKVMTGLSASQIRDFDKHQTKPYSTQVACFRLNGPLNFAQIQETFLKRVIVKTDDSKSIPTLLYPELQQYFVTFMGYVFMKKDIHFKLENHITFLNEQSQEPVRNKDVMRLWEELMTKPFLKERSPWDFTVVKNYMPDKNEILAWNKATGAPKTGHYWVCFLRVHHSLADGFSLQKMLSYLADNVYLPKFSNKITPTQKFLMNLRATLLGPYDILNRVLRFSENFHIMHLPAEKHSHEYFVLESELIPMSKVKLIKQRLNVPFTVILIAAISGGLRNFLIKQNLPIPKYMSTGIPFATEEHSDGFTNEFSIATLGLGIHLDDQKKRVNYIKNQMKLLVSSSWVRMMDVIIDCLGCFPIRLLRLVTKKSLFSSTYSTQPGPTKCMEAFGSKLLEVNFSYGTGTDSLGLGLSSITYNKNFRVVLFVERKLVKSREHAEDLVSLITKEFSELEGVIVNKADSNGQENSIDRQTPGNLIKHIKYD